MLGKLDLLCDLLPLFFCVSQTWEGRDVASCAVSCCAWKIGERGRKAGGNGDGYVIFYAYYRFIIQTYCCITYYIISLIYGGQRC